MRYSSALAHFARSYVNRCSETSDGKRPTDQAVDATRAAHRRHLGRLFGYLPDMDQMPVRIAIASIADASGDGWQPQPEVSVFHLLVRVIPCASPSVKGGGGHKMTNVALPDGRCGKREDQPAGGVA